MEVSSLGGDAGGLVNNDASSLGLPAGRGRENADGNNMVSRCRVR